MPAFLLTCTFAGFCGLSGCDDGQNDHAVRARIDPALLLGEFWPSAEPGLEPTPTIVHVGGLARNEWTLFAPGMLSGNWMMTVTPSSGDAFLTYHGAALVWDVFSARGRSAIVPEPV